MLNVKQRSYEFQLLKSFGLTRPGNRTLVYGLRGGSFNHLIGHWAEPGAAPRGRLGRNSPPTPHKGHFCKSSKTDEKILRVWGGVTSPTIL